MQHGYWERDISGCGISAMMNREGLRVSGEQILKSICLLHDRSNGLGGGFAAYGIYPDFPDCYAFHLMLDHEQALEQCDRLLKERFNVAKAEEIPTRPTPHIGNVPLLWRYFVTVRREWIETNGLADDDAVMRAVMDINDGIEGAFVLSSGKNMGAFKAVGYAEHVGHFYRLDEYGAYTWIAHGRFPTNTQGWWGGAHPFTLLDWGVVHNGEISSYGINRRYLEMFGYKCTLHTDTEVIAYLLDLLIRRHRLPLELACAALAPPFWKDIDRMAPSQKQKMEALRVIYGPAMLNGPFAIVFGFTGGMVGLNDRIKLRPLVAGEKDEWLFIASEESAILEICPRPDRTWAPKAGSPVIGRLGQREVAVKAA